MIDIDPAIVSGYVVAIAVLVLGLIYGIYKAVRGE